MIDDLEDERSPQEIHQLQLLHDALPEFRLPITITGGSSTTKCIEEEIIEQVAKLPYVPKGVVDTTKYIIETLQAVYDMATHLGTLFTKDEALKYLPEIIRQAWAAWDRVGEELTPQTDYYVERYLWRFKDRISAAVTGFYIDVFGFNYFEEMIDIVGRLKP